MENKGGGRDEKCMEKKRKRAGRERGQKTWRRGMKKRLSE